MCWINWIITREEVGRSSEEIRRNLKKMNQAIKHRGPDDSGVWVEVGRNSEEIWRNFLLWFGHVRLAILDLSEAGHQPMFYHPDLGASSEKFNPENIKHSQVCIVFNWEIYNFKEIKQELQSQWFKFTTSTDTEVILVSYLKRWTDCVKKFNWMWAFAIYDKRKNIVFASRDRMWKKPFYYWWDWKQFVFSSEIKGILQYKQINDVKNINKEALDFYFSLWFIPSPYSVYKNVYKLESRQNLMLNLDNFQIKKRYYRDLPNYNPIYDKNKLIDEWKQLLYDAVKLRMRSDVPVGAFLSWGLDSTTIVWLMKRFTDLEKLHTFSIGFEWKYDETKYINIAVNYYKTQHHHYYFKYEDFEKLIDIYSYIYDEPFGDYSWFPTYKVSEIAKKFVTVVLSWDWWDEIFWWYRFHLIGRRIEIIRKTPYFLRKYLLNLLEKINVTWDNLVYFLKEFLKLSILKDDKEFYSILLDGNFILSNNVKQRVSEKLNCSLVKWDDILSEWLRIFDLLFRTLSDNFLVKVDRASMANSLEVRSPFLDYRFLEFSQKIPVEWKFDMFKTKKLMKEMIKDVLPKEIIKRNKQGFEPPMIEWILSKKKTIDSWIEELKLLENLELYNYLEFYENIIKNSNSKLNNIYKIRLFLFKRWYDKWILDIPK